MVLEHIVVRVAILVALAWIVLKALHFAYLRSPYLSFVLRARSKHHLHMLMKEFSSKYKREPHRDELVSLIVKASHDIVKDSGSSGHWMRQKIRKYLSEKYGVITNYEMK